MKRQRTRMMTPGFGVFEAAKSVVPTLTAVVALLLFLALSGPASATSDDAEQTSTTETADDATAEGATAADPEADALLREGGEVYSQICSSCHQPGGAGLSGTFPPLLGNPNVDDTEYVDEVINNGLEGEITVLGTTYSGVMPAFSTLGDDEVNAVIAYLQADFAAPSGAQEAFAASPTGPEAGTELPFFASAGALLVYLLVAAVAALVFAPRLIGVSDRLEISWLDAWLKSAVIVVAIVLATVILPDLVLQSSTVAGLDRIAQDLIGLTVWGGGLLACLVVLWWAHRESRI